MQENIMVSVNKKYKQKYNKTDKCMYRNAQLLVLITKLKNSSLVHLHKFLFDP